MGRDLAFKKFARAGAVLGLAAVTTMGMFGVAGAAPADRATDPVVLKGNALPNLIKSAPDKIVAYKWQNKWVQIPVQIDERHVIGGRSLYPDDPVGYITGVVGVDQINDFDVEVYADPKTRSGADADKTFDSDDELVFMGGDSGASAPASAAAPGGVNPSSVTKVAVNDPIAGGNAFVYLFKANKAVDQSAGKDYVDYSFKLTNFGPKDSLINNYGFTNTPNPEDSTVKTDNYELHSIDRWREDKLAITAGGAPGVNILDREAVSAGSLSSCSRSEYTFSANWAMDTDPGNDSNTDDEGTYVTVIDGPVRAIRSYMGANSGPYVEDVHRYYADRHDRSIYVRVHPIPHMYVWTDYNEAALGMTYRDQKNQAGVTIDGAPGQVNGQPGDDSINLFGHSDFVDGTYAWQQVTGANGTTTTMATANSSASPGGLFNGFKGYYLDEANASGSGKRQCGGDGHAYGASGFGIDGTYPNTDPVFGVGAEPARLSVDRVRYFSGPNGTAAEADAFRARAQDPLAGSASTVKFKAPLAKLKVKAQGKPKVTKRGKKAKIKVKVTNSGTAASAKGKLCVTGKAIGKSCKNIPAIAAGKSRTITLTPAVKKNAKGKKAALKVQATSGKLKAAGKVNLQIKR